MSVLCCSDAVPSKALSHGYPLEHPYNKVEWDGWLSPRSCDVCGYRCDTHTHTHAHTHAHIYCTCAHTQSQERATEVAHRQVEERREKVHLQRKEKIREHSENMRRYLMAVLPETHPLVSLLHSFPENIK